MYDPSANYPPVQTAKIYADTSKIPYKFFKIGQINAKGGATVSNETLLQAMIEEARRKGADGIIEVEFFDRPYVGSFPYVGVTTVNKPGAKGILIRFERDDNGNPISR